MLLGFQSFLHAEQFAMVHGTEHQLSAKEAIGGDMVSEKVGSSHYSDTISICLPDI